MQQLQRGWRQPGWGGVSSFTAQQAEKADDAGTCGCRRATRPNRLRHQRLMRFYGCRPTPTVLWRQLLLRNRSIWCTGSVSVKAVAKLLHGFTTTTTLTQHIESVADGWRRAALSRRKIHASSATHVSEHFTTTIPAERLCPICAHIRIQTSDISSSNCCDYVLLNCSLAICIVCIFKVFSQSDDKCSNYRECKGARPHSSTTGPLDSEKNGLKGAWFGLLCSHF